MTRNIYTHAILSARTVEDLPSDLFVDLFEFDTPAEQNGMDWFAYLGLARTQ